MQKPSLKNNSSSSGMKVNVIGKLEFELAYYDSAVQRFNHYITLKNDHYHKQCYNQHYINL